MGLVSVLKKAVKWLSRSTMLMTLYKSWRQIKIRRLFQSIPSHFWCLKMWSSMVVFEASHLEIYRKSRSKKLQRSNRKRYMHRSKNASLLLKTSQLNPVVWETHKWTWCARFYHYSRKNAHLCKLSRFRSCSKTTNSLPK